MLSLIIITAMHLMPTITLITSMIDEREKLRLVEIKEEQTLKDLILTSSELKKLNFVYKIQVQMYKSIWT